MELLANQLHIETAMRDTYKCFMAAIRHKVYVQKEMTQVALAKHCGVTSEHLNAIIKERSSKKGGKPVKASQDLQECLAGAFNYTLVGFYDLGKRVMEGMTEAELADLEADSEESLRPAFRDMDNEELAKDAYAFLSEVEKQLANINSATSEYIDMLVEDRNRMNRHLQRKQAILNCLGDRVKSVDRDMVIKYCNAAYRANKGLGAGETCRDEDCDGRECIAERVFHSGKPISEIVQRKGRWVGVNAFPMFDSYGEVSEVVVSARDITSFHEKALRGEAGK